MHTLKLPFAQLMDHLPPMVFERCVARYRGHHQVKSLGCKDHFRCMAFAQLTFRDSLRDIGACPRPQAEKLNHMGIPGQVSRNTLDLTTIDLSRSLDEVLQILSLELFEKTPPDAAYRRSEVP